MKKSILLTLLTCYYLSLLGQTDQMVYYKKVIEYLASDELEGRLTGMPGELKSAQFIQQEMINFGLKGGNNDTFIQEFDYPYLRIASSKSKLFIGDTTGANDFAYGKEFVLLSECANRASINAQVYDAGYGITYAKKGHDDYDKFENTDSGKVFLIKLGHPENDNPHSAFGFVSGIKSKIKNALAHGASGILFHNPDSLENVPSGKLKKNVTPSKIPIAFTSLNLGETKNLVEIGIEARIENVLKQGHNVIGVYVRNPKKKYLVIGAHHDHIGRAELGNSRSTGQEIHNGADDNASGIAMMLHLAKTLPNHKAFKKYNLVFVAFSGEELGLLGSKYFVKNCPIDTAQILAMINFDMVGRLNISNHTAVINGIGTSPYWKKRMKRIKLDTSQFRINTTDGGIGASDHTSFYLANIPAVHLFSGQHREYHMPEDDVELINYPGMLLIEDYTIKLICKIPKRKRKFRTTKNTNHTPTQFKVTLGVMPDYTFGGAGMRLDNVSSGKSADKAGLLRNDIITKMGIHEVGNVEEYMHALSKFKKGDTIDVVILRNGISITKKLTFL